MRFELGVNVDLTGRFYPPEEEVGRVVEMGFDVLYCDGGVCNMPEADFLRVKRAIEDAGARVQSVHSTAMAPKLGEPADSILPRHREIVERAAQLGAKRLTHHPGQWWGLGEELTDNDRMAELLGGVDGDYPRRVHVEVLRGIAEAARPKGIEPTIENLPSNFAGGLFADLDDLISLADEAGVAICYDLGHGFVEGFDPAWALLKIGRRLAETHFNDSFGRLSESIGDNDVHTPAGIGVVNWPEVIVALERIGYNRPVVFEQGGPGRAGLDRLALSQVTLTNWRLFEELLEKHPPLRQAAEKSVAQKSRR